MTPMLTPTLLAALGPVLALPGAVTETIARLPRAPDFTGALNELAGSWGDAIGRASWQAGLLAVGAWAVTRLWGRRLPAAVTAALWWLVAAKVLVALVWAAPVRLPVLPASIAASGGALAEQITPLTAVLQTGNVGGGKGGRRGGGLSPTPAAGIRSGASATSSAATDTSAAAAAASAAAASTATASGGSSPARTMPTPLTMLFCLWGAGVLCHAGLAIRQFQTARALVARAVPLSGANGLAVQREVDRLAERLGLSRHFPPEVRVSEAIAGPLLVGLSRSPVILLPAHLLPPPADAAAALSPEELRLVLAHEMAHLRRFDPLLGLVPALAAALLFFHPLVRLASREFDIARESACDAAALEATGDAPGRYGQLLLKLGTLGHVVPLGVILGRPGRPAPTGTLAAVSEYVPLRRRLVLLQQLLTREGRGPAAPTRRQRIARYLSFAFIGTAGLVPWRMVAMPSPAGDAAATAEQRVPPQQQEQQQEQVRARSDEPAATTRRHPAASPRRATPAAAAARLSAPATAPRPSAHALPPVPAVRSLDLESGSAAASERDFALTADEAVLAGIGPALAVLRLPVPAAAIDRDGVNGDALTGPAAEEGAGAGAIVAAPPQFAATAGAATGATPAVAARQTVTAAMTLPEAAIQEELRAREAAEETMAVRRQGEHSAALVWIVPTPEGFALALGLPLAAPEAAGQTGAGAAAATTADAAPAAAPAVATPPAAHPAIEAQSLSADGQQQGEPSPRAPEAAEEEEGGREALPLPSESFAPVTLSSGRATETRRGGAAAAPELRSVQQHTPGCLQVARKRPFKAQRERAVRRA